jgi:hypothetical protein
MARPQLVGATAAAMLPAALSAAVLISAPFAGTTTTPLADTARAPAQSVHQVAHQPTVNHPTRPAADRPTANLRLNFSVSKTGFAMMAASEALLVGLGAGVIVWARRRRFIED